MSSYWILITEAYKVSPLSRYHGQTDQQLGQESNLFAPPTTSPVSVVMRVLPFRHLTVSLATDLNRRPADYKSAALPTELARQVPEEGLITHTQVISTNTAPF